MRPELIICIIPMLTGCDWMDAAEGKSPGKDYVERIAALEAGMAQIKPTTPPQPIYTAPIQEPECIPVFRVVTCP